MFIIRWIVRALVAAIASFAWRKFLESRQQRRRGGWNQAARSFR